MKRSLLRQRLTLLLIFAIGAAPLAAALVWYLNAGQWRPADTVNYGHLVTPARPIASAPLPVLGGGTLPAHWFAHRWTLVYIGTAGCDTECRHALYVTRQIRLAVGARMNRVQRLWAMPGKPPAVAELKRAHPDLTVVDTVGDSRFAAQFTTAVPAGARIYIVDPRGRLVMSYPADADPQGILADLEHLLKYSQIG